MQTKRSFLALITSVSGMHSLATAQSSDESKPLREREVSLKGKHQSLKEYYLELISQDAEIKKQFQKLENELIGEKDVHYNGPGNPTVISWVPHSAEFGRQENDRHERFLILHPLEWAKSHYFWTENAIFSEFECVTTHLDDGRDSDTEVKAVYKFFGFRKVRLEPAGT
jgi:hypothetical protein